LFQNLKSILLKDSFKQVGVYTITGSLSKIISFCALPFFVNTLTAGDIGILTIFSNSIVFLSPIISLGVLYTISIDYFTLPKEKYSIVFSTSLVVPVFFCVLLIPLLYIFKVPLEKTFNFQQPFFWLIPACLFLNFCFEAFAILMRNKNEVRLFAIVSLIKVLLEIGLSILLIIFIYRNWYSRALGFLLSGMVVAFLFFMYIKKENFLVGNINFKGLKKELYFGLSGLLLQTAIFFICTADKFFVMTFFGKEQAGYYSVASTFAAIQFIVCTSLLQYLSPLLYKNFAELQKWKMLKSIYYKYFATMFATFIGVLIFTFIVYNFILKTAYKEYLFYAYLLGLSSFIWTVCNIFLQYLIFSKNKKVIFQLSIITILVSITLNYLSSRYLTIQWLCVMQIISTLFLLVVILIFNKKLKYFN
jgi:O-antigen/teichoic acid export membrane protein